MERQHPQASPRGVETTWISPDPQKTTPRTIQSAPPSLPPTNAPPRPCNHHHRLTVNHVARLARQKRENSYEGSSTVASRRERPPPPSAVADRMQRQGQPGPYWPGRASIGPVKPRHRIAASKQATITATHPRGPAPPTAGGAATAPEAAQPDPDGPKGPKSGPVGRRRPRSGDQPANLRLPRPPCRQEATPSPPGTPEPRPDQRRPKHAAAGRRAPRHHSTRTGKDRRRRRHRTGNARRPTLAAAERRKGEGGWKMVARVCPCSPARGRDRSEGCDQTRDFKRISQHAR
jgi:hypothetical protein